MDVKRYSTIVVDDAGKVARITLNRPEVHNAFNGDHDPRAARAASRRPRATRRCGSSSSRGRAGRSAPGRT